MKHNERLSNIEMLRIVAMLMILVVHFDGAALGLPNPEGEWGVEAWSKTVVEALSIIGVNLFVLISGYFGITTTRRRIIDYLVMCGTYSIGIFAAVAIVEPAKLTVDNTVDALLFLSHNDLWFVRDYFFLMLLAPIINSGWEHLSRRQSDIVVGSIVLISCYFGWLWHGYDNPTGYTLLQMATIYILGARLRRHRLSRQAAGALYAASTLGIILCARLMAPTMAYAYNSPFVIAAAVGLFSMFVALDFRSQAVNRVASCTFAVYLIHKDPYIWGGFLKPLVGRLYVALPGMGFVAAVAGLTIAVFAASILIEMLRRRLMRALGIAPRKSTES